MRTECLDWILLLGRRHLTWLLQEYVGHYNQHRPNRGLDLGVPVPSDDTVVTPPSFPIDRRDVFGGLIHEYLPQAA